MRKKQITLTWNKELLRTIKNNFGTEDPQVIKSLIIEFLKNGSLDNSTLKEEIQRADLKLKQSKLENFGYKNRIDKVRADSYEKYHQSFGTAPTSQGEKAIQKYATRPLNITEKENLLKLVTIRKDAYNQNLYSAKCNVCNTGENYDSYFKAEDDLIRHLQTEHKEQVQLLQ